MKKPFVVAGAALLAAALPLVGCASTPQAAPAATEEKKPEGSCGGEKKPEGSCGGEKKPEGSCGGEKKPEGSCGEGSCGGAPKN